MPLYIARDPETGEEVELNAPEGMSQQDAERKAFGTSVGRAMTKAGKVVRGVGDAITSGGTKGLLGLMTLPWQAGVGLGLRGAQLVDELAGTNLTEPLERGVTALEKPIRENPNIQREVDIAEKRFDSAPLRYLKEGVAGATGGALGLPGKAAFAGGLTGGIGGVAGQAAQEAGLSPGLQLLATVFPMLAYGGYKAYRDPIAVQQIKSALAATGPDDLAKAQQLIASAKARGVDLSPAQALGANHPLVPILEQVGRSTGGSDKVKIFLNQQEAPTNVLTDQVTNAFGKTDTTTAANVVAQRAAGIRAAQEKAPGARAAPYYNAAKNEPLPPGLIDDLRNQLTDLKTNLAPKGADVAAIDKAISLLSPGEKSIEKVSLNLADDGTMSLVKGKEVVPIPLDTFGQLKNVRDLTKPPDVNAVVQAGDFPATFNTQRGINSAVREATKQSPNISAADALFAKRVKDLEKVRMGPLTQLAGPQMRNEDAASNFARVQQFLDPARNSPEKISRTLSQLADPKQKVVQQLTAGHLHNATEQARKTEGYAPAKIETVLRGGEGSGKKSVLEALIRRSIGEQNKAHPMDPLDANAHVKSLMENLDIMEATGRGRGALSGVENMPRVAAQLDTPVQMARGAALNLVSQTPSIIRFGENKANRELAEALTDPSMKKLLEARDYDRLALLKELLIRATQTASVTGEE